MLSVAAAASAADDDFLYGSSPGTDTDHGLAASALVPHPPPHSQQPNQGSAAARVWASGYQDHDQVCRPSRQSILEVILA